MLQLIVVDQTLDLLVHDVESLLQLELLVVQALTLELLLFVSTVNNVVHLDG